MAPPAPLADAHGYIPPSPPGFGTADFSSQPLADTALQVIMVNRH